VAFAPFSRCLSALLFALPFCTDAAPAQSLPDFSAPVLLAPANSAQNLWLGNAANTLYANQSSRLEIRITPANNGLYRLVANDARIAALPGGIVALRSGDLGDAQLFRITSAQGNLKFFSIAQKAYLRVDPATGALWADAQSDSAATAFRAQVASSVPVNDTRAVHLRVTNNAKSISPNLYGIFFEDLSFAADGGLYAELVANRSFEYTASDRPGWNGLTNWHLDANPANSLTLAKDAPLHPNNPTYALWQTATTASTLSNDGFDGIPVAAGESFHFSIFRKLISGSATATHVRLVAANGAILADSALPAATSVWHKVAIDLKSQAADEKAHLELVQSQPATIALDMVSLFPSETFHHLPNGMRPDLAQTIADLHPKFMRFPGGCLVHGNGLGNMYRWKESIGPIEQRLEQPNLWGYHQSLGLGFFEFFEFAEAIGATPLPILPAGVSCGNSGAVVTERWDHAQQALPLDLMPQYVQDVLDLVEYANGPANSPWGSKRAAAGHPEPFHLRYLGVGNEDMQTEAFRTRFELLRKALHDSHPEIVIIGTVGPYPAGPDFTSGWNFASSQGIAMVDEHYYQPPDWFYENQWRYDNYDRSKPHVYVGEYAARDNGHSTMHSALAEAVHLTNLERNADVVEMSSYAPLLSKTGHSNWEPDLIHFTNTSVTPSISYWVQSLFSNNAGDKYLASTSDLPLASIQMATSAVLDSHTGDRILKLVNYGSTVRTLSIAFDTTLAPTQTLSISTLTADPQTTNETAANPVKPITTTATVASLNALKLPANSVLILRIPAAK